MTRTEAPTRALGGRALATPPSIPLDAISAPGCYVCNWDGFLLRVPSAAIPRRSALNIVGPEPLYVTKISDDPALPLPQARLVAATMHISVRF